MAMFDDPKKELKKLEEQLLQEEAWFEAELDSAKRMLGEEVAPKKKAAPPKTAPQTKRSLEETQVYRRPASGGQKPAVNTVVARPAANPQVRNYANDYGKDPSRLVRNTENVDINLDEEPAPKRKQNRGLVILAILETLGIVGVVAYWLLFLL